MTPSRREALLGTLSLATIPLLVPSTSLYAQPAVARQGAWRRGHDGQRLADLGDGTYLNPILAGDHPSPTVLKDGSDYYATFASLDYYPGLIIWHSRDLVNWSPIGPVLSEPLGTIHAPELVKHDARYFIYFAAHSLPWSEQAQDFSPYAGTSMFVLHADAPEGPWTGPFDVGITGRGNPGHAVGDDGNRYLFLNDGFRVRLSPDGLRAIGEPTKAYQGWPIPQTMINEGFSLDSPKLIRRDGWFYMFSAQGGAGGPPNGHMVIVARARSLDGPWENAPNTPLVRTESRDDPWWSRGQATPVEGPDGRWWIIYAAYEKNLRSLGRQVILEPIEWGPEGWPRALGGILDKPLASPAVVSESAHGRTLGGPVDRQDFGSRFAFFRPWPGYMSRVEISNGELALTGQGTGPGNSSPLALIAGDRRYAFSFEVEVHDGAEAGLLLFYDEGLFCGLATEGRNLRRYKLGEAMHYPPLLLEVGSRVFFKVEYKEDVAQFFVSRDGVSWERVTTQDVAGYNHNMAGDFLSLRPALFVSGPGAATFRSIRYDGAI